MAHDQTRRLTLRQMQEDLDALAALKTMTGYTPANAAFTLDKVTAQETKTRGAQEAETQADAALKARRDQAVAEEWAMHNVILGVKAQVRAQFGDDSDQIQALGMKKASERQKPTRRASVPPKTP